MQNIIRFKFEFELQARGKMFHSGFPDKVFMYRGVVNSSPNPEPNLSSYCIPAP